LSPEEPKQEVPTQNYGLLQRRKKLKEHQLRTLEMNNSTKDLKPDDFEDLIKELHLQLHTLNI